MNKSEFIKSIASKSGLGEKNSEAALNAILASIEEALIHGDEISLDGFGSFKVRERPERIGKNPRTNEEIKIPATKEPIFKFLNNEGTKIPSEVSKTLYDNSKYSDLPTGKSELDFSVERPVNSSVVIISVHQEFRSNNRRNDPRPEFYSNSKMTIQRKLKGEDYFIDLAQVDYIVSNDGYTTVGIYYYSIVGCAKYTDTSIDKEKDYVYRAWHIHENIIYYTNEVEVLAVPAIPRDTNTIKLGTLERLDLFWSDSWTPQNNDVFKYELQRQTRQKEYIKVTDLDINVKHVTDFVPYEDLYDQVIIKPETPGIARYRIVCTCISSDNSANIGKIYISKEFLFPVFPRPF